MKEINVAATIVAKRREKGITQGELAAHIGVSIASVSKWETGQSYPDIEFLPLIAGFFDISIDELMNYTPQMTQENIEKLYKRLSKRFSKEPIADVLEECRNIVKKYYSCYPLLYQMSLLLFNHNILAETEEEKDAMLCETVRLIDRVRKESGDKILSQNAAYLQSLCHMKLRDPQSVIDLLNSSWDNKMIDEMLTVQAYGAKGDMFRAKKISQVSMHQHLICLLDASVNYLELCVTDDMEKAEAVFERILPIMDAFKIEQLNPDLAIHIYVVRAQFYCKQGQMDNALQMLENCVDLYTKNILQNKKHEDDFFNMVEPSMPGCESWETLQIKLAIEEIAISRLLRNPAFAILKKEPRYVRTMHKLKNYFVGREDISAF